MSKQFPCEETGCTVTIILSLLDGTTTYQHGENTEHRRTFSWDEVCSSIRHLRPQMHGQRTTGYGTRYGFSSAVLRWFEEIHQYEVAQETRKEVLNYVS